MSVTDGDREKAWLVLCALPISIPGYSPETVRKANDHLAQALADEREKARAPFLALAACLRTLYKGEEWDAEGIADLIDEAAVDGQPVEFQRLNRPSTLRGRAVPRRAAEEYE